MGVREGCWVLVQPVDWASFGWNDTSFLSKGVSVPMLEFLLKPWHLIVLYLAAHLNREPRFTLPNLFSISTADLFAHI